METKVEYKTTHYYVFSSKVPVSIRLSMLENSPGETDFSLSVSHDADGAVCSGISRFGINEDTFHSLKKLFDYYEGK